MPAEGSAFARLAAAVAAGGAVNEHLFHRGLIGPQCDFLKDARNALLTETEATDFRALLEQVKPSVTQRCAGSRDSSLAKRWEAIYSAVLFALTGDLDSLEASVKAFDDAFLLLELPGPSAFPSLATTGQLSTALNKFFAGRSIAYAETPSVFEQPQWTPGVFLLHDWLLALTRGQDSSSKREATPILSVLEDRGGNYLGSVQKLVVEELDGPQGSITPDFFSFVLAAFPTAEDENFIAVMHRAFLDAQGARKAARLRWYVEPLFGNYPSAFAGRSAQVAAACCGLALADPNRKENHPLLDERSAMTACLGPAADTPQGWSIFPFPLPTDSTSSHKKLIQVEDKKLNAKFDAAARARLVAVFACESQLPQRRTFTVEFKDTSSHTVLVHPVNTLADAYESLLVTSDCMRKYIVNKCASWNWKEERTTPREYIDASGRADR